MINAIQSMAQHKLICIFLIASTLQPGLAKEIVNQAVTVNQDSLRSKPWSRPENHPEFRAFGGEHQKVNDLGVRFLQRS